MRGLYVLVVAAGCGFQAGGGAASGDNAPGDDQPGSDGSNGSGSGSDIIPPMEIAHVAPADEAGLTSTFDWGVPLSQTLDTGTMQANPPLPSGVVVKMVAQENGGPGLLILQANSIELPAAATFKVVGPRALVLVAATQITIAGTLDASADHDTPGPAGAGPEQGAGAGAHGVSDANGWDSGANGASYGGVGGKGGDVPDPHNIFPAAASQTYGVAALTTLVGGSGGGNSNPTACNTKGGGGGGAIQLTSKTISITGSVRANGGGGVGGTACTTAAGTMDASSGGGGGSGGSIYVQADMVTGTGWLVANGGAGGGGGCQSCTGAMRTGGSGENGTATNVPASGGSCSLTPAGYGVGGAGAAGTVAAMDGVHGGNGGGGGGGAGRIHLTVLAASINGLNASPEAQ